MPIQPYIPLGEEFTAQRWVNYTSFDAATKAQLPFQHHLDIRPFTEVPIAFGGGDFLAPEDWVLPTESSTGPQAELENFPALKLHIVNGTVEAVSNVPDHPLDLSGFGEHDKLVFTLPKYPAAHVEVLTLILKGGGQEVVVHCNPLLEELDPETFICVTSLDYALLKAITEVKFIVQGTAVDTLYIAGLRVVEAAGENPTVKPGWMQSTVDFDNWNGRLHRPVPLGKMNREADFGQSIIWKADSPSGPTDPQPIDSEFGVVFNTGEAENGDSFTMYFRQESKIFTTMLDLIGVKMSELDGHPQPDLGERQFLPRTVGEFDEAEMGKLDAFDMEELERRSVPNPILESWVYFTFSWKGTQATISMGNSSGLNYTFTDLEGVTLAENHNYYVVFTLEGPKARARLYDLYQEVEDRVVEGHVQGGIDEVGPGKYEPNGKYFAVIQQPLYDTGWISDDNVFRRRKGRVGWSASFKDADAFIRSIRPRGVTFAEYKSAPLASHTPVAGASLFANMEPSDISLWNGDLFLYPENKNKQHAFLSVDKARTTTRNGASTRVTNKGVPKQGEFQGLQTEFLSFTDFEQAQIEFDLWFAGPAREKEKIETIFHGFYPGHHSFPGKHRYPGAKLIITTEPTIPSIIARLVSTDGTIIPLVMPELETNQWQHISLDIPAEDMVQTGYYKVQILQQTRLATNWWVDQFKVIQRTVEWSARAVPDDPWEGNYAPWTDFQSIVNDREHRGGIMLAPRGNELQMRARARRQDVIVSKPELIPRYAELGRLVWPENKFVGTPPTAKFKVEKEGTEKLKFTDESTVGSGAIVNRVWTFGDGTRLISNAPVIEHRYAVAGKYSVTLAVTDRYGQTNSHTKEVEAS